MNDTQTKKGRGRPTGSNSFTEVTLAELNAKYKPEDKIQVGRIWFNKDRVDTSTPVPQMHVSTPAETTAEVVYDASSEPQEQTPAPEMTLSE
jgi:hypothetical protein